MTLEQKIKMIEDRLVELTEKIKVEPKVNRQKELRELIKSNQKMLEILNEKNSPISAKKFRR